ncbi:hypothetical protein M406DRAFT_352685 [Cryphonectria parasitica EP155]|uniref:Uncharacterized protein n=1 Tax=Cryphonectria parasitica (strain ATCC 38755 / EP155) TaxID=660469 RepID=A0A9P4XWI1_CRYP1|nr:uncharacterized protein M406DRAFT_352685 [Cryphonectria parasitica EP155]KAF3762298.1 hypothetical protein M406DRAFT_352685 [Cryphonectria parasitica EP155]
MEDAATTTPTARLGWIGLGSMGIGMAVNLQKHLSASRNTNLHYYNRTMARGEPLKAIGGVPCVHVGDLVSRSDVIFLSLSDDAALSSTLDAIIEAAKASSGLSGKLIVDTSTVHPTSSTRAQARLAQEGVKMVAAPVFGASPVAAQGKLLFILAGPDEAVQAISPYLVGVMGRGVIRLGEDVSQSSMLKTAGNFMTAAMMEVVAEAHVFAEKTGVGSEAMESLIEQQYGPLALSMSKRLTTGAYMPAKDERPWSDLNLALKDVGHGIGCAKDAGARLPVGELALAHLQEAKAFSDEKGRAMDSSSMYGVLRRQAGLDFETDLVKQRDEAKRPG